MVYLEEIIEHRREELKIFRRASKLLSELGKDDSEILERVLEREESIYAAVKAVKKVKIPQTSYYYHALGRLLQIQARHNAKKWLNRKYKSKKKTKEALEKLGRARLRSGRTNPLRPSRLAELREWDLLFAAYHHVILPEAERKRKDYSIHDAFKEGMIKHPGAGTEQLKNEEKTLHIWLRKYMGLTHYSFLQELFFEFLEKGKIPTRAEARNLPNANYVLRRHYRNVSLENEWGDCFESIKSKLDPHLSAILHRWEEFKIVRRDPRLLAELDPGSSELIQRVHGLGSYEKRQSAYAAVKAVKKCKIPQTFYYYDALGKLIRLQAKHSNPKRWLDKKYESKEKTLEELAGIGSPRAAELAGSRRWYLLFAAYHHKIFPKPRYSPESYDKCDVFEQGVMEYLAVEPAQLGDKGTHYDLVRAHIGQLRKEEKTIYSRIRYFIGINLYKTLVHLLSELFEKNKMPGGRRVRRVLREYCRGKYTGLKKGWQAYFERAKSKLREIDITIIMGDRYGVPREVTEAGRDIYKRPIITIFRDHPKYRKRLSTVFERIKGEDYHWYISLLRNPEGMRVDNFEDALEKAERCSEPPGKKGKQTRRRRRRREEVGYEGFREPYKVHLPAGIKIS